MACKTMLLEAVGEGQGEVLGPAPAGIARIRGSYRYHVLLKLTAGRLTESFALGLQDTIARRFRNPPALVSIDVDPGSLM